MLFQPAKLLLMAVALGSLLCTVASVDIGLFSRNGCQRLVQFCQRIRQRNCCATAGTIPAQSARLYNARRGDRLIANRRSGRFPCARTVATGRGRSCVSRAGRYDGVQWCRNCRILDGDGAERITAAEAGGGKCVEPNLLRIGEKWVEVNGTTPEVDKNRLWGLIDSDGAEAIPNDLLKYVTAPPDLGEEVDMAGEDDVGDEE
ncbi:hypothetical protein FQN53_001705 [Emmonsiellopsis sp. PD_33]|nr:hypothetical protein FQN53_001705 [Emmonsiellopsis sp. PD_33]